MSMSLKSLTLAAATLVLSFLSTNAGALTFPRHSESDPQIGYVTYKVDDVVGIAVRRGTLTRIVLEPGELVVKPGLGFPSDCKDGEWCVHANPGDDQIWIKPLRGATHNNLELATNKRHYSFQFRVIPDTDKLSKEWVRVIFQYPIPLPAPPLALTETVSTKINAAPVSRSTAPEDKPNDLPVPKNLKYSVDTTLNGATIKPDLIFDDGVFTYFRFKGNRTIPAIFAVGTDGEESVNHSMVVSQGKVSDLLKVHRLAERFVLRDGASVVGVWNEAYDPIGVAVTNGSTAPNTQRVVK